MELIWDTLAMIARKMGDGTGFPIVLGSYLAMVLIERLAYLLEPEHRWNDRDAVANILNSVFHAVVNGLFAGALVIGAYMLIYEYLRVFTIPFVWWGWVIAFLLNDLAYYADHRLAHRTGLFWAVHTTHHSSREMTLLVANRGTVLDFGGASAPATYFLMPLLGVHPAMFLAVKFFGNLWGIFNHTRLVRRMGILEEILATPANHRVHHGTEAKYLDKNYGQVLIIWDRLFGTFQREEEEPTFGLVKQMESYRIWDIQTWGAQWLIGRMRSADRWSDRLKYLIMPPSWSHDGAHETTRELVDAHRSSQPQEPAN